MVPAFEVSLWSILHSGPYYKPFPMKNIRTTVFNKYRLTDETEIELCAVQYMTINSELRLHIKVWESIFVM